MKGWNDERRRKQAENARKTKPWQQATGPRTDDGKAASAANATKHGFDSAPMLRLRRALAVQKKLLQIFKE